MKQVWMALVLLTCGCLQLRTSNVITPAAYNWETYQPPTTTTVTTTTTTTTYRFPTAEELLIKYTGTLPTTTTTIKINITLQTHIISNSRGGLPDSRKPWLPQLTPPKRQKRIIDVPESFQTCENNSECMIVYDCCGELGKEYPINRYYKTLWENNLECHLIENRICGSCSNGMCRYGKHPNTICANQTCQLTYDSPQPHFI